MGGAPRSADAAGAPRKAPPQMPPQPKAASSGSRPPTIPRAYPRAAQLYAGGGSREDLRPVRPKLSNASSRDRSETLSEVYVPSTGWEQPETEGWQEAGPPAPPEEDDESFVLVEVENDSDGSEFEEIWTVRTTGLNQTGMVPKEKEMIHLNQDKVRSTRL